MYQLDLVYLHYKPKAGLMHDIGDVYLGVFAPAFFDGKYHDDNTIIYTAEKSPNYYNLNKGLDKENKGYITKGDAVEAVLQERKEYI